jgi:hypothetical protein
MTNQSAYPVTFDSYIQGAGGAISSGHVNEFYARKFWYYVKNEGERKCKREGKYV